MTSRSRAQRCGVEARRGRRAPDSHRACVWERPRCPPPPALLASVGAVRCACAPTWTTCRGQAPRALDRVKTRRRAAFRKAAQERERIPIHKGRPVCEGALEGQPHQTVLLQFDALHGDRGSQHVAQKRLPPRGMVRTGARRRVQGEAVERGALRLVVDERARRRRRQAAEPLRAGGRLSSRDGGGAERSFGLVVLLDLVLEREEPVPAEGSHHPPDGVREHLTDLARLQMTELVPYQLCAHGGATGRGGRWGAPAHPEPTGPVSPPPTALSESTATRRSARAARPGAMR
jgi:hypothetical protein